MDENGMNLEPALGQLWGDRAALQDCVRMPGDASTRSYYRITAPGGTPASAVVMRLPPDALTSDEGDSSPAPEELPFLNVGRHLLARGVRVPKVWVADVPRRVLILEDLGDETFEARLTQRPRAQWPNLYGQAVDSLVAMHTACATPDPDCLAYRRGFDRELLRWELDHFLRWGLIAVGYSPDGQQLPRLEGNFDALVEKLLALPRGFTHRDYQSRNLMWKQDELVVIDFQDALEGPRAYDLAALLCDSYVALDESLQTEMLARYARQAGLSGAARERFELGFWQVAVQRKLKDAGRFVFIDQVRGNPDFLPFYGPSLKYVGRALARCGQTELSNLLAELIPGFPGEVATPAAATGSQVGAPA